MTHNKFYKYDYKNYQIEDNDITLSLKQNYSLYPHTYPRQHKKKSVGTIFLIIFCFILFGLAFYLSKNINKKVNYYFLQANEFLNYKQACELSNDVQEKQGAGYIYYDGKYHVFICFYPNKEDAENVLNNIKSNYPTASIYTMSETAYRENSIYTKEENKEIKNMILTVNNGINQTYNKILAHDKGEINNNYLQINFKEIYENYEKNFENFKKTLKYNKNYTIFINVLSEIEENYKNLYSFSKTDFEAYQLKYELVKIVNNHVSFLSCL